jgi:hypothetical protein
MADPETTHVQCLTCKRVTKHEVVRKEDAEDYVEEAGIHFWESYRIVRCCGCATLSFEHLAANSDDLDDRGQPVYTMTLYPSRTVRQPVDGHHHLPSKVGKIYKETLTCLSDDAPILAAAGLRATVEAVCQDKKAGGGNLEKSVDLLVKKGFLSADQAEFLHLQRFLGNIAVHEIEPPAPEELLAALNIIENLLTTLCVLPITAAKMKRSQSELAKRRGKLAGLASAKKNPEADAE